jgi:hypothetical protein
MANKFTAATRIKHGRRTEDGSAEGKYESVTFEQGEEVKGLEPSEMKELWEAGALVKAEGDETETPKESSKSKAPSAPEDPPKK